jgi:hypothetical protein
MFRKIAILVVVFTIGALGFASVSLAQDATATPTATTTATTQATAQATATPQAGAAQMQGTDPGSAGPIPSGGQTLGVGEQRWYKFQYAGDNSEIQIQMNTNPGASAGFSVWTEQNIRNWQQGGAEQPVGRGAPNEDRGGDLFWSGSFNTAGPVYVRVEQMGAVPANYGLTVKGTGVTLGQQTPVQAAATPQAEGQTQSQTQAQGQASVPQTLPVTGGEVTLLVAAFGALSLAAGMGLRRLGRR